MPTVARLRLSATVERAGGYCAVLAAGTGSSADRGSKPDGRTGESRGKTDGGSSHLESAHVFLPCKK